MKINNKANELVIYLNVPNERIDMMIEKTLNVAITKCYGNADEDNTRGKLNIPKKMLKAMGITENDRTVKIIYNEIKNELIITKV